ncbi:MAG: hypothetical protein WDO24_20750 [Pseudomonadota bacterium]
MAVLTRKCACDAGIYDARPGRGRWARAGSRAVVLALGASLCSCSVAQKADVFDWFGSDKPADQTTPLSSDEPYPNLADVPGRPARPPAIDRDKIAEGLVADRENAQYTEDVIRRAPEPAPRPAPAARATASPPPAPAAPLPPSVPPVQTSSLPEPTPPPPSPATGAGL